MKNIKSLTATVLLSCGFNQMASKFDAVSASSKKIDTSKQSAPSADPTEL